MSNLLFLTASASRGNRAQGVFAWLSLTLRRLCAAVVPQRGADHAFGDECPAACAPWIATENHAWGHAALLAHEHGVLARALGQAQRRCSRIVAAQTRTIERLEAQLIRQRAAAMRKETQLAWLIEDLRVSVSQRAARSRRGPSSLPLRHTAIVCIDPGLDRGQVNAGFDDAEPNEVPEDLRAALAAADWVVCQTGCIGHNDYWRVQDYCKRHGKPCVLVEQPSTQALNHLLRAIPYAQDDAA